MNFLDIFIIEWCCKVMPKVIKIAIFKWIYERLFGEI
jgi:hypothetical protein